MKQYSTVVAKDLSFTYVKCYIYDNKGYTFMTYKDWENVHFISKQGEWCIYTKNNELIKNVPLEAIQCQDKRGWMIVKIKENVVEDIIDLLDEDNL